MANDADDDLSSSSDSDDDFLTTSNTRGGGGAIGSAAPSDREALVRKKLLENFYGKTALMDDTTAAAATASTTATSTTAAVQRTTSSSSSSRRTKSSAVGGGQELLDDTSGSERKSSTAVDTIVLESEQHAEQLLRTATTKELLETEEKLSLQVRTLDSTMQTLVYENYSRFIDATDAIRSIGINVSANEHGLQQLTAAMNAIQDHTRIIDDAIGTIRDQVAEKIRVQRLLTRLDTLLNLPSTLHEQIAQGKYRTATKSYYQVASVLAKHSQGFESLKSIESECHTILQQLKHDLEHKVLHWSGRGTASSGFLDEVYSDDDDDEGDHDDKDDDKVGANRTKATTTTTAVSDKVQADVPHPPLTMAEIFECAGTLFMLYHAEDMAASSSNDATTTDNVTTTTSIHSASSQRTASGGSSRSWAERLYSSTIAAALRLLDRLLDSHLIQVQERKFSSHIDLDNSHNKGMVAAVASDPAKLDGSSLIPRDVLDGILTGATLYGTSFSTTSDKANDTHSVNYYLMEFVTDAFSAFIAHVRSVLLEESIQANREGGGYATDDGNESSHEEVSLALVLLVQHVQDLASGLVEPSIGIHPDYAAKFVDQTMELAESVVNRRVDQKFYDLRLAIVKDCLVPFATRAVTERSTALQDHKPVLPQIVQLASSTLSDCMQLVDDTIRSIFADSSSASGDLPDLKDAAQTSTYRFALWLANAFEIMAGGDSTETAHLAEAPLDEDNNNASESADMAGGDEMEGFEVTGKSTQDMVEDDFADYSDQELIDMMVAARVQLSNDDGTVHADYILAIVELCRLSEVSVSENLEQSFTSHLGVGKKKSRSIFPSDSTDAVNSSGSKEDTELRKCFKLAGSRILVLFAMSAGTDAAYIVTKDLSEISMKSDEDPLTSPSSSALTVVSLAKQTSSECARLFGGSARGGHIPVWDDSLAGFTSTTAFLLSTRKTGLQLDVERMFKETVTIYPHPSELLELNRNAVMFLFFKIVFRAVFETARLYTYSTRGYEQLQVDMTFLKHMVPHYLSNDYVEKGTTVNGCQALITLLGDVMEVVDSRCTDENCPHDDTLKQEARNLVRTFVTTIVNDDTALADQFVIQEA